MRRLQVTIRVQSCIGARFLVLFQPIQHKVMR